jgi:HEAT repeat protein
MKRCWPWLSAAIALAAPASAHLLVRGIPLSELAVTSPTAVIGRVENASRDASGLNVTLAVQDAVLGSAPPGSLRFVTEGHHPPEYEVGTRVLVFLTGASAPWVSRQTALDHVVIPDRAARDALVAAVRAYAGLRGVSDRTERIAQLKTLALGNLESASERVSREALLDLLALAPGKILDAMDVARLTALARRPQTPRTLAPGLVALLAAVEGPDAGPALVAVLRSAASPQARALAAQAVGRRPDAVPVLGEALRDPALEVRLTAQRALEQIDSPAARATLKQNAAAQSPSNELDSTGGES